MTGDEIRRMYERRVEGMSKKQLKQRYGECLTGTERELIEAQLVKLNGKGGNTAQKSGKKEVVKV